jgi:glycosyltransferase involved in cell wall biosynthesis
MKICLVTAFPPSRRGLAEYGYHIARELQNDPLLSVTILGDNLGSGPPELPEFDVVRCWDFNSLASPYKLLSTIRSLKPDVVWFNLLFSTFGEKPVPAALGLTIPALTRMMGFYTHVTLHHLMDNIDLDHAGIKLKKLYRAAGNIATRVLLMSNSISVLLPAYRRTLMEKYRGDNVHFRAHGILSARPEFPDVSQRGNPEHRIVAFGKWGTYKRPELLIEAFAQVSEAMPNTRLIIAGGDHPMTPGYIQSLKERWEGSTKVQFTGYVAESDIPALFKSASVMVMPYSSATGSSGVAHLACEYGLPIICADIGDFREMAQDEGLAIDFYDTDDSDSLAESLLALLDDPQRQRDMAEQNFSAALRQTMPLIMRQYLRAFDLQRRARALEPISRFRRLPGWVPSRSAIFRAAAPRWAAWM